MGQKKRGGGVEADSLGTQVMERLALEVLGSNPDLFG